MTKILITGANSFVGKNFLNNSVNEHINEVCLIKNKVEDIDFSNYDVILHLAAIVHQTKTIPESEYFKINTDLCLNVAKKAKKDGVKQFVFMSSVKVYGEYSPNNRVWNEISECTPNDSYGKSKYAAELGLMELKDKSFNVSVIRPPLIYGIGVKANMLNLIKLIDRIPVIPLDKINNKRSLTSIENLVQLIDKVIDKNISGVFLAMDEFPLSTTELSRIIIKSLGKNVKLFELPKILKKIGKKIFPGVFERLYGSLEVENTITKNSLSYVPKLSTEEGIKKMVKAYLEEKNKNKSPH